MVANISSALVNALFGARSSTETGIGSDMLTAWARSRAGIGVDTTTIGNDPNAPFAPVWQPGFTPAESVLVDRAFTKKAFFDTGAKLYSDLGATGDYRRLFALHTGLATMSALASAAGADKVTPARQSQIEAQFARGLAEMKAFFAQQQFEDLRLAQGDRVDEAQTSLALASRAEDYVTGLIHRGGLYERVSGLVADATFEIVATSAGGTERRVTIDLAQMGSVPQTLSNVVSFINGRLTAAGAASRLETVDQTPKTNTLVVGGRTISTPYTGARQYALKLDVRANERVAFEPIAADHAFYVVGSVNGGARLIKLADVNGEGGQPDWLDRPDATVSPTGANIAKGWFGPGAEYGALPANAYEAQSVAMMSAGANNFEDRLRAAGEAVLKLDLGDGRVVSVSTAWRGGDQEAWRVRTGEDGDRAILDDLAERLTQLLHEQGIAAGVDVWEDAGEAGLSVFTADGVATSSLAISGRSVTLENIDPPGMVGGLRDGVFARRLEAGAVAGASDLFVGNQNFTITTATSTHAIAIDGGEDGVDAPTLIARLNEKLRDKGIAAAASFEDVGGALTLRFDALHSVRDVAATLNEDVHDLDLAAPGAWAAGGLPASSAGQPFFDALRTTTLAGSPLATYTGALSIEIDVATANGTKTVSVAVSALERANDPDPAPGEWSAAFRARLDAALNVAGVYVSADSAELTSWRAAEGAGHRIAAIRVNGDAQTPSADAGALGGAFTVERSFTGAAAATGVGDDVAALQGDPSVSITLNTVWGARTISVTLEPGDPRTLESAALRLNEALAAAGYDSGVAATALSGGGAGLRIVTGNSHTVRGVGALSIGGAASATTLDPIDSTSMADDPVGALRVAARASRGAGVTETIASNSAFSAPSANAAGWFPGRAFDVAVGAGMKVATARAVATGADGAVYVLADLDGDSATTPIKGVRDVALLKYDSAGKLAFSRILGASNSANGYALAVSAEGNVAVAGSVAGGLSGAGVEKGAVDSFVALYDDEGVALWTQRRAASANDEVRALAFASDGSVIVAGKTESAISFGAALGSSDGYVRGFSAAGAELFTRRFGTTGADAATALLVRDDGAGGFEITTGGVENERGLLRRFTYSAGAGLSVGAERDMGYFHKGAINALAYDAGALYVGGEAGADRVTIGAAARAGVAGIEGFVARMDVSLGAGALDRTSYLGSAQDDSVRGLAIVGGAVYAAGVSGGVIAGQGNALAKQGFLAKLDADGDIAWTRAFNSAGGAVTVNGLAVDTAGASSLDVLGLPRGVANPSDTSALTGRSALRAGDEFSIGVEGRRLTTIRIDANDTMASLVAKMNRAIGGGGRAQLVREDGAERIKLTANDGRAVRIEAGGAGRDALPALGLGAGVIAKNGALGAAKIYGLGIVESDLKLNDKAAIAKTKAELSAASSIVRQAYDSLLRPNAKEPTAAEKALQARRDAAGRAPEYYTRQLANYQAALARLGG